MDVVRGARVVVAATAGALVVGLAGPPAAPAARQKVIARVEADAKKTRTRVASSFIGFSLGVNYARDFIALDLKPGVPRKANPLFVSFARRLAAFGGGAPGLRIGGASGDQSFYPDASGTYPPGATWAIDQTYLRDVRAYLQASGARVIMPINLALSRPDLARRMAQAVTTEIPRASLRGLEIGNEPDTYPLFFLHPGRHIRGSGYNARRYAGELTNYVRAIRQVAPRVPIVGPSTIGYRWGVNAFPALIKAQRSRLSLVSVHRYPIFDCAGPGKVRKVALSELLGRGSLEGQLKALARFAKAARKARRPIRVTQTNSVACGHARGVTNTMGAALWGVDWMFMLAALGYNGADFLTSGAPYSALSIAKTKAGAPVAIVRPLYYSMLLFAEATSNRARVIGGTERATLGTKGAAHAWATYDRVDRVVHVVVTNKSRRTGYAEVHVPGATGNGRLKRLLAESIRSPRVTWAGQHFGRPALDANLIGTPQVLTSTRRKGSRFRIRVPGASAALLTVPVRRR